jgi:hypothetical protein
MSTGSPLINLTRDIEAIQIPSGLTKKLEKGTPVIITQALGGTYTVVVEHSAGLFRVLAQDADALGKTEVAPANGAVGVSSKADGPVKEDDIWTPQEGGGAFVEVKMTLTAPGCGMGPSIASDAQRKILTVPGVTDAQVDVVWDPPWSADRISADGKAKLGMV